MAEKDTHLPGLLSKVAKFVRNPTKDWSALDDDAEGPESAFDKQALKDMIERKRQNDFVRKREFDQLRKLRNRESMVRANQAAASEFPSSLATDPDERAMTLKKIDEIEAQMSRQWWSAKKDGAAPTSVTSPTASGPLASVQAAETTQAATIDTRVSTQPNSDPFTLPQDTLPGDLAANKALGDTVPARRTAVFPRSVSPSTLSLSNSEFLAVDVTPAAVNDPELEEAAIRFANADDPGVAKVLRAALAENDHTDHNKQTWLLALLDLYRATGEQAQFMQCLHEYAAYVPLPLPVWEPLQAVAPMATQSIPAVQWYSPAVVDGAAMESLRAVMAAQPMPWHMDWHALQKVDPGAMPLLRELFVSLSTSPVDLYLSGADVLSQVLRDMTPTGDRSVDRMWWEVRWLVLRVVQQLDQFELMALDYCMTYGETPPEWQPGQCRCLALTGGGALQAPLSGSDSEPSVQVPTVTMPLEPSAASRVALRGMVLGDASGLLAGLDAALTPGVPVAVDCRELVRVDFAAAGSILNWVAARAARGCRVEFHGVHRLVAAFFHVIGIHEHAKVIVRAADGA